MGVVDDVEYDLPPAPVERPNLVGSHKVKLFHRVLVQDGVGRMKHAELLTYHLQVLTFRVWSVFGESTHSHTARDVLNFRVWCVYTHHTIVCSVSILVDIHPDDVRTT